MTIEKIITHDTTFHADEVFAVALLRSICGEIPVYRTRDPRTLEGAKGDRTTFVLDVGGEYHPPMNNYDHHQDTALPSAAGLIWRHLKDALCKESEQPYFQQFIDSIDAMDTNRDNIYAKWRELPLGFRNTSSIIGGFNRDPKDPVVQDYMFSHAVELAKVIIANELHSAFEKAKSEREYENRVILPNNVAVFHEFCPIWKEKEEHVFAVMPHANGWQIQSRDTAIAVVPESVEHVPGFVFRHKSGFMATVKDFDVAVEFAKGAL